MTWHRRGYYWLVLCGLLTSLLSLQNPSATASDGAITEQDRDGDGLADTFEQALIERFLPRFYVGEADCDVRPSRFVAGQAAPQAESPNGTIYGQAFPAPNGPSGQPRLELHFYHLWAKDCGRLAHPLDVERVSVLLETKGDATQADSWNALYWYAAAHEDTVCDVSHGAWAGALDATERGAKIWISLNKHASYLSAKRCKLGCGGDVCKKMKELRVPEVLNIGESGKPLNGALWTASPAWPFQAKMKPDFDEATLAQFAAGNPRKLFAVNQGVPPVRATILAGNETLDGVAVGSKHTGSALGTGKQATENALGRAFRAVGKFLNGEKDKKTPETENSPGATAASPVRQ